MRLMQHMFPQLLTEIPNVVLVRQPVVPEGAILAKSFDPFSVITTAIGAVAGSVATIITTPDNNRTAQEIARQNTLQLEINANSASEARAQQMQMLKYAVPAVLIGITLYLLLR
jgi:hypothetical protein